MLTLASFTSLAKRSVSFLIYRAICRGVLPIGSAPMSAIFLRNSAEVMIVTISVFSRVTTSLGVAPGVRMQNQVPRSKPLRPASSSVGTPAYLDKRGSPKVPHDLARHDCIGIRQGGEAYGTWRLSLGKRTKTVKERGNLSTNDGEIAVNWALAGHGIVMRAEWDIARYLRSGRLRQVLENYRTLSADIYAVYPQRHQVSARVRAFVDFLVAHFEKLSIRAEGMLADW